MPKWNIDFISEDDFKKHLLTTISAYKNTLKSIDLKKFNSNIIDPIKMTFDSIIYRKDIEKIIEEELIRQRDKTNNNSIGYFHQNIFNYINGCEVPKKGFDIIFHKHENTNIYIEMKNKHNTMNSSSSSNSYMRMQNQALKDANCLCYLVEIIARKSQNKIWSISKDGVKLENERIRRVSIDKFYEEVTGDSLAFYKICQQLPIKIGELVTERSEFRLEQDTVLSELMEINPDIKKALYILAFKTYEGFNSEE